MPMSMFGNFVHLFGDAAKLHWRKCDTSEPKFLLGGMLGRHLKIVRKLLGDCVALQSRLHFCMILTDLSLQKDSLFDFIFPDFANLA